MKTTIAYLSLLSTVENKTMPDFDETGKKYQNKKGRLTKKGLSLGFLETKQYDIYRITLYKTKTKFIVAVYNTKNNKTEREEFNYLSHARKHYDYAEAWIVAKK